MDSLAQRWQDRADRYLDLANPLALRVTGDVEEAAPVVAALAALAVACTQRARIAAAAECPTCDGAGVVPDAGRYAPCPNRVTHST